jgi:hypothetical protein
MLWAERLNLLGLGRLQERPNLSRAIHTDIKGTVTPFFCSLQDHSCGHYRRFHTSTAELMKTFFNESGYWTADEKLDAARSNKFDEI